MSNVRSTPIGAPINRKHLDAARTPFRVLLGAAFVAYSSLGTVAGVRSLLAPALAQAPDGATIGLIVGVVVALVIFGAEVLLSDVSLAWYLVPLLPDTYFTYRFSGWIEAIVRAQIKAEPTATALVVLITAAFSLAVAYFGERLLFGKRRRR
jgi:hypothetical protein